MLLASACACFCSAVRPARQGMKKVGSFTFEVPSIVLLMNQLLGMMKSAGFAFVPTIPPSMSFAPMSVRGPSVDGSTWRRSRPFASLQGRWYMCVDEAARSSMLVCVCVFWHGPPRDASSRPFSCWSTFGGLIGACGLVQQRIELSRWISSGRASRRARGPIVGAQPWIPQLLYLSQGGSQMGGYMPLASLLFPFKAMHGSPTRSLYILRGLEGPKQHRVA